MQDGPEPNIDEDDVPAERHEAENPAAVPVPVASPPDDPHLAMAHRIQVARIMLARVFKVSSTAWIRERFEVLAGASEELDWLRVVCAWAVLQCRYATLKVPTVVCSVVVPSSIAYLGWQNNGLPLDGRPDAVSAYVGSRSNTMPEDLSNLHAQMVDWFVKMQPPSRNPHKGFAKMRAATGIDPNEFTAMRSTASRGLALFMTGLSWLYHPDCAHPDGVVSRADLVAEVRTVFKVMCRL